jgi:DNA-binding LacI/PurR family transcriptional regulator
VTGFDDIPVAAFSVPALTTVRMPIREMVGEALRMLIDEGLDGGDGTGPADTRILQPSLVIRASSGPVAADAGVGERAPAGG